jgi:hypothetical protein
MSNFFSPVFFNQDRAVPYLPPGTNAQKRGAFDTEQCSIIRVDGRSTNYWRQARSLAGKQSGLLTHPLPKCRMIRHNSRRAAFARSSVGRPGNRLQDAV